jgi:hypothetical protein
MFQKLVSHNDDIRRLVKKGYAVGFDAGNYLVVRDIPYLDQSGALHWGAIVTKFIDEGKDKIRQHDHQIFFCGSHPHGMEGKPIPNLGGGTTTLALSAGSSDITVQRSFSNKPSATGKFQDFFEKIESYVTIISGPAIELHKVSPLTFRMVEEGKSESPFKVRDTMTSQAEIGDLASKFKDDVIAIIGTGGTGGYLLDFMVKTPVKEIRAFDMDAYYVHNAFRSPGHLDLAEIGKTKAEVYQARYENFRHGLTIVPKFIDSTCAEDLRGVTFAFVCVDKGTSRAGIFDLLISMNIPFIDVGMGLNRKQGALNGMLRVTYYSVEKAIEMRSKGYAELADAEDDVYRANIQIGELNALNACLAVLRFKQLRGFYFDEVNFNHLLFGLGDLEILGNGETPQD